MIYQFIQTICNILKIPLPSVSFDTSVFPSDKVKAMYIHNKNTIYLCPSEKPDFEFLFSIAHELRHGWQFQNDPEFYFADYRGFTECLSIDEYNDQRAEVDANAFAELIMNSFFHIRPEFYSLSEASRKKIHQRANELKKELSP